MTNYEYAKDELKIGGDVEKAKVFALLALVQELDHCTTALIERLDYIRDAIDRSGNK